MGVKLGLVFSHLMAIGPAVTGNLKNNTMNNKIIITTLASTFVLIVLTSGIIRHDVSEKEYLKLANEKQFDGVGQVYIDTSSRGSCVLINERFLLSAAHVFIESDYRQDTIMYEGQKIVAFNPYNNHLVDVIKVSILLKGQKLKVKRITLHPNYLDKDSEGSCDLALIELESSFKAVKPAIINRNLDEMSFNVVGVGFGVSGIANKPETVMPLDKKIAGQNIIDSIGGFEYLGKPTLLFCDFDNPTRNDCNKMGSATPRPLEYICGGGDSGGGLFRIRDNRWELIGICSGSKTDIQQLLKTGYYGQIMSWTRVAAFEKWITENLN